MVKYSTNLILSLNYHLIHNMEHYNLEESNMGTWESKLITYIYILVYLGSRSFIMQVSLNFRWDVSLINFIVNHSNFLNKTFMSSDETRRMIKDSHFERKLYSVIL